jgi:hypothetical protein
MWCKSCRQEVPGLVSPGEKCYCCARCGSVLQVDNSQSASPPIEHSGRVGRLDAGPLDAGPLDAGQRLAVRYDPWELNERLRHIQRVLHGGPLARQGVPGSNLRGDFSPATAEADDSPQPARWVAIISWPLMTLGFGVFACGAALVGLGLVNGRSELWRLGLPTVLAGQFALLLALVLQLAGRNLGRKPVSNQVREFDEQLASLRRRLAESGALK